MTVFNTVSSHTCLSPWDLFSILHPSSAAFFLSAWYPTPHSSCSCPRGCYGLASTTLVSRICWHTVRSDWLPAMVKGGATKINKKGRKGRGKKRKAVILVVRWMAEVAQIQAALSSILEWEKCWEIKKPDEEQRAAWFWAWAGESERRTHWNTVGQTAKNEEQRNEGEAWSCTEEMHNPIPQLPSWYPDQDGECEKRKQRQNI